MAALSANERLGLFQIPPIQVHCPREVVLFTLRPRLVVCRAQRSFVVPEKERNKERNKERKKERKKERNRRRVTSV